MATKRNPGPFDCYANADPDEPLFVLLGRDKHAPALVWMWAALREMDDEDPVKVAEARQCVAAMMKWSFDHNRQVVGVGELALSAMAEVMTALSSLPPAVCEAFHKSAEPLDGLRMVISNRLPHPTEESQ